MISIFYFCFISILTGVHSSDIHEELKVLKTVVYEQSRLLKELQSSVDTLRQKNEFLEQAYTVQKQELQILKESLGGGELEHDSIPHSDAR
jgi:uncharacterized protein YaaN involved in tellurite resistance